MFGQGMQDKHSIAKASNVSFGEQHKTKVFEWMYKKLSKGRHDIEAQG